MAEAQRKQAEADARAKAEAEAAARRQASEEDQRKAEAEAATRRQADEAQAKAQAEREKAETEAKIKAEADKEAAAATKLKEEAETAEKALRLEQADRQRLQVALTSLGFDTRGNDGVFGPRSREMIAAWQKKAVAPATGFLTAAQRDELLRTAAPAVASWEEERKKAEEQKKLEDDKKKSEAIQAMAPPASPSPPVQATPTPATTSPPGAFDGTYTATTVSPDGGRVTFTLTVTNGRGSLGIRSTACSTPIAITMSPAGEISGQGNLSCPIVGGGGFFGLVPATITGRARDGKVALTLSTRRVDLSATLDRSGGGASPAAAQPSVAAAAPAGPSASPDGPWRGTYACTAVGSAAKLPSFTLDLNLKLANGISSGGGFRESYGNARTLNIEVSVNPPNVTVTRTYMMATGNSPPQRGSLQGQFDGTSIRASGRQFVGTGTDVTYDCTLALTRVP